MWTVPIQLAVAAALPLVVIDPGHGGAQDGAKGICGELEKDVVLKISRELAELVETSGRARTLLTRTDDSDIALEERAEIANRENADIFVSVHANASTHSRYAGVETFFLSQSATEKRHRALVERENEGRRIEQEASESALNRVLNRLTHEASHRESQRLAIRLHDELARKTRYRARGVMQAPFIVLKRAGMAAALVEVGFLTHPRECRELASVKHQRKIAQQLAGGIIAHLELEATANRRPVANALTR